MAKRIDAELRAQIVDAYLADPAIRYKDLAQRYHIGISTVQRIIHDQVEAGKCVKPDRRKRSVKRSPDGSEGISEAEMDKRHAERMAAQNAERHPRTSDWMDHITPLHQRKMELENAIEHKQVELDKARQEYRDFLATLRQLMEENV
jgi:transposase